MPRPLIGSAALLALLSLSGCGGETDAPENVRSIEVPEGDYQSRLQSMPEGQRNAVFIRALRDAGFECQGVKASSLVGDADGAPTWQATCEDGTEWTIVIGRDGVAQVVNTAALQGAAGNAAVPVKNTE